MTGYHVERRMTSSSRWLKINKDVITELKMTIDDLIDDNEYELRVMAENKVGVGPPSEPTKPFVAKNPFGEFSRRFQYIISHP